MPVSKTVWAQFICIYRLVFWKDHNVTIRTPPYYCMHWVLDLFLTLLHITAAFARIGTGQHSRPQDQYYPPMVALAVVLGLPVGGLWDYIHLLIFTMTGECSYCTHHMQGTMQSVE